VALVCGFSTDEIRRFVKPVQGLPKPCIVSHPGSGRESLHFPNASIFERRTVTRVKSLDEGVRKAILRISAKQLGDLRVLSKRGELEQYFALRYKVWNEAGYLPADSPLHDGGWELDCCDRFSKPIGLFLPSGRLIGCARLVEAFGKENKQLIRIIADLIERRGDPAVIKAFAYQGRMEQPFDILWEFHGFRSYYRKLFLSHTSMAEVSRVVVDPEFRGRGLLEVLVDSLVSIARVEKVERLLLACPEAIGRLYQRCGFSPVAGLVLEKFFNIHKRSIVMDRVVRTARR
jgi:GNAT superfamily N-acetyltransferase